MTRSSQTSGRYFPVMRSSILQMASMSSSVTGLMFTAATACEYAATSVSTLPPPSRFSRERDYVRLVELVGRLRRAGGSAFLHPGGLQWLLRRTALGHFAMWVWYDGDDPVAFVVEDGDYAMPHADTTRVDLTELLRWTERHARDAGRRELEISVWDADSALRDAIVRAGYQPTGQFGPELVWRMAG